VRVDARAIYTNNIPTGAFRGFGGPQSAYAVEGQMNKLAEALKIDPVEIRMRNLLGEGDPLLVQTPLPEGVSIKEVVEACALKAGWHKDTNSGWKKPVIEELIDENTVRGIGFACGFKNVGFSFGAPENCWAIIELHGETEIEKVVLRHAGADVGQGSHTAFVIMAAKALNIPVEKIQIVASDTGLTRDSGSVSASRMTFMAGNAIIGAAKAALEKWQNEERPAIAEYQYWAPKTSKFDPETGACRPSFSYGYVAQAAEVEIDKETGETRLLKVVCADDVGNAINPPQVEGQIEGGVVQAAGYALMENFIEKNGLAQTKKLSTYLIPTVLDIPGEVDFVKVEHPDPNGPWGARGIGEMPFLPMVPAITDAVHDALGLWINEFPLTAERVSNAIDSRK
jgi:CO/xanthine dehydrogenase Mo-binding subunit